MKILLDLQACQASSRQRGIGRYSMSLTRELLRLGSLHEFHVLLNGAFADTVDAVRNDLAGRVPAERVHVFHVPGGGRDDETQRHWRAHAAIAIRRCAIRQVRPDLVHVASLFEGLNDDCIVEIDPQLDGAPTAVTVYDFIPWLYADRYLGSPRVRAWYERRLDSLRRADLLLGISASACAEAEAVLPERRGRVVNVSSAADPRLFFPAEPGDAARRLGLTRPFVMYTGGIDWRKNIEGLVSAFAALPRPLRAGLQLAVVCHMEPHARTLLLTHARAAGLQRDEIVLTGYVSDEDLADLYRSCELFVFPSLHEGFGLPVLEAMMCGAPVIGADTSSIPEVIGRPDALFDPRSIEGMTALMQRGLQDEAFRASLKQHAPVQASRFSWEHSARVALDAMEQLHARRSTPPASPIRARPTLAMHSPLPPSPSGIAAYTCELLPVLREHYDIELVAGSGAARLPPELADLPVRDCDAFLEHASRYDRIVYQFGNSSHHAHMFELLRRAPGCVVLHDFFLSGVLNWMEVRGGVPDAFRSALLRSHGKAALEFDRSHDRVESISRFPANRFVIERATGVIVHSAFSCAAAQTWYGPHAADGWRHIPHLRALPVRADREGARRELGLRPDEFLVCTFGQIDRTKLNDRLLRVWQASALGSDARCKLVMVGGAADESYGQEIERLAARWPGRVSITGYATREMYERYLCAADAAVQLRTMSRGEVSGAVLDCLAWGVPLVANANGPMAEYPADVLKLLPDAFTDEELTLALETLRNDPGERQRLAVAGREHVRLHHDPVVIAGKYRDAIEHFALRPQHRAYWDAVNSLGALGPASADDLTEAAVALEATWRRAPAA